MKVLAGLAITACSLSAGCSWFDRVGYAMPVADYCTVLAGDYDGTFDILGRMDPEARESYRGALRTFVYSESFVARADKEDSRELALTIRRGIADRTLTPEERREATDAFGELQTRAARLCER